MELQYFSHILAPLLKSFVPNLTNVPVSLFLKIDQYVWLQSVCESEGREGA